MNKMQLRAKIENHAMLITKYNLTSKNALELQKVAKSLHRLNENACNYGLTERQESRERNLFTKVQELFLSGEAIPYETLSPTLFIREQGDPRGWPLEISLEPMTDSQTYDYVCPF
tara:strand:+ start:249 stop:596 length:348 start_codon:yes stop_codon:yes gene_type:complete